MAREENRSSHQRSESFNLKLTSQVAVAEEVELVTVFQADTELFELFVGSLWDAMNEQWGAMHDGMPLPVSQEELIAYSYTAVRTRISRVTNSRFYARCDDDWCLPAIIAHIVNQIGRVALEQPVVTIVPVWDPINDIKLVQDQLTWWSITNRMRTIKADPHMRVVFVKSLSGEKIGSPDVMSLIPVRDELGRIVRVYGKKPVDGMAAAVFFISGLNPMIYTGLTLGAPVRSIPGDFYLDRGAVIQSLWRLVDTASA